jgi:tRNA (adenine22-N1)-methyltransferase
MGGGLIATILENGKDKLMNVSRLILQPNLAANLVREWLVKNDWELIKENILEEDGHIYEILVAERGESKRPYQNIDKELLFGPFLLKVKNNIFRNKWKREYKEWIRIYEQLEKANDNEQVRSKKEQLKQYIEWYKEEFGNEATERT